MAKKGESKGTKGAQIDLNISEAKDFLRHTIKTNQELQAKGNWPVAIELISDAGIGKTTIVQQIAEEHKLHFVKINLAQIEELGDLVGFCMKEFEVCKDDKCEWIPESALDQYLKMGYAFTNESRMSYAAPEWIAGKEEGGILLLDDAWRGDPRFINAVMEIISRQEYISWKLPKNWHVVLTNNPADGEYLVNEIDDAQRTRFVSIGLKFDVKEWAKWAEEQGIDGRCINFVLLNPEVVSKKVNPRSLVTFFNLISSLKDFNASLPMIQMIGEGSIGPESTGMFVSFINNKLDKLVTPEFIMTRDFDEVTKSLKKLCGSTNVGDYRADIASVLSTRVINYSLTLAKDNEIKKSYLDRIEELVLEELFGADLSYYMVKTIFAGNAKFKTLAMRKELTKHVIS